MHSAPTLVPSRSVTWGAGADLAPFPYPHLRLDYGPITYGRSLLYHRERPYMHTLADMHGRIDDGGRVYARRAHRLRRRKHLRGGHACVVGIRNTDYRTRRSMRPVMWKQHCARLCLLHELHVLGVLAETQVSGHGLLKAAAREKIHVIALEGAAQNVRQFRCFHQYTSMFDLSNESSHSLGIPHALNLLKGAPLCLREEERRRNEIQRRKSRKHEEHWPIAPVLDKLQKHV